MLKAGFAIEVVLAPLSSVINYAPYTEQTLKDVIAHRPKRQCGMKWPLSGIIAD